MKVFDASRPSFAPYGLTCEMWTPSAMPRPDRHNEIELNLLKCGALHYLLGGRRVVIPAGRLAVFWAAIPHQVLGSEDGSQYFAATIPLAWFLQWQMPEPFVHDILRGGVQFGPEADQTGAELAQFGRWVQEMQDSRPIAKRLILLEMKARLLRLSLSVPARRGATRVGGAPAKGFGPAVFTRVEQMASYIARHYTRKIRAEEIGRAVALHPNYAMNLFKRTLGLSLVDCVTQHRVTHAQRLLATTDDKIVNIALASGFNSVSRFNEAFKRECTCSPRQYRKLHWRLPARSWSLTPALLGS